jgi:hypothetical protein
MAPHAPARVVQPRSVLSMLVLGFLDGVMMTHPNRRIAVGDGTALRRDVLVDRDDVSVEQNLPLQCRNCEGTLGRGRRRWGAGWACPTLGPAGARVGAGACASKVKVPSKPR